MTKPREPLRVAFMCDGGFSSKYSAHATSKTAGYKSIHVEVNPRGWGGLKPDHREELNELNEKQ